MLLSPLPPGHCHDDDDDEDDLNADFDDDDDDVDHDDDIDDYNGGYPFHNHQIRPAGGNGDAFKDS